MIDGSVGQWSRHRWRQQTREPRDVCRNKACSPVFHTFEKAVQTHPLAPCSRLLAGGTRAAGTRKKNEQKRRRWRRARACQSGTSRAGRGDIQALLRAGPVRAPSAEPRLHAPPGLPLARPGSAERLGLAGGATRGLCCGHLGRSSGASQRLGRASFTHAATTESEMSGTSVEP